MPKNFVKNYYIFFGLLDLVALSAAFILSIKVLPTYFSYFTVLSNILITTLFLYIGFFNIKKDSKDLQWVYGAAVLYMSITGIIYWSILVNAHSLSLDPWINLMLHGIMPIAAFLGWLIAPPRDKIDYKLAKEWLIPPLFFVAYTLIRGPIVHWYPYPFFNPTLPGGYLHVFISTLAILTGAWLVGLILIWLSRHLKHI